MNDVVVISCTIPLAGRLTQMVHCKVIQRQSMELQSEKRNRVPWWCFGINYRRNKLDLVNMKGEERLAYYNC